MSNPFNFALKVLSGGPKTGVNYRITHDPKRPWTAQYKCDVVSKETGEILVPSREWWTHSAESARWTAKKDYKRYLAQQRDEPVRVYNY